MDPKRTGRVTIAEIAKEAGVSVATVSRVVNRVDHPINPRTRKRVEEVVKRLHYTSNMFGKGLAGQPNIIGVSCGVPLSADPGFSQSVARIIDGVKLVTRDRGFHILLETEDIRAEASGLHVFDGVPLAGALHIAPREKDAVVARLRARDIPFVIVGSAEFEDCNFVDADNETAGRRAVQHLASLGRKGLAFFCGAPDFGPSVAMLNGFRMELARHGLPVRDEWVQTPPMTVEGGRQAAMRILALKERPDSIFAFTDFLAVGALQAAREMGFDVPGDIAVVGYDDFAISSAVIPQLTTFRHPDMEMAASAAEYLLECISKRRKDERAFQRLYEPTLIVRGSCGANPS